MDCNRSAYQRYQYCSFLQSLVVIQLPVPSTLLFTPETPEIHSVRLQLQHHELHWATACLYLVLVDLTTEIQESYHIGLLFRNFRVTLEWILTPRRLQQIHNPGTLLCTENSFLKIDEDTCHSKSSNGTTWKDVKEHKERNLIITRTSLIATNAA